MRTTQDEECYVVIRNLSKAFGKLLSIGNRFVAPYDPPRTHTNATQTLKYHPTTSTQAVCKVYNTVHTHEAIGCEKRQIVCT